MNEDELVLRLTPDNAKIEIADRVQPFARRPGVLAAIHKLAYALVVEMEKTDREMEAFLKSDDLSAPMPGTEDPRLVLEPKEALRFSANVEPGPTFSNSSTALPRMTVGSAGVNARGWPLCVRCHHELFSEILGADGRYCGIYIASDNVRDGVWRCGTCLWRGTVGFIFPERTS